MEPCTATPLPVLVDVQGRSYLWSQEEGLDPTVVFTVRGYIYQQARRLEGPARSLGVSLDDLVQEGTLGALLAARRFDPDRGVQFLTFAAWWVKQRMLAALGQDAISIPPRTREILRKAGELPACASLDIPVGAGEDGAWVDLLAGDEAGTQVLAEARDLKTRLHDALLKLPREERTLLVRRYGLGGRPAESLEVVAEGLGLASETVRHRQVKAERRLRRLLRGKRPALQGSALA
jgi:RNA polymerase sigma factor (sigma-70 family)